MNKDTTLVILAAGIGSRFGGLKQIEPIGPNGEYIIDYSIYDAIEAGFNKVVFIIKEENYKIFKKTIGSRIEDKIKVNYVFQNNNNVPKIYKKLKERKKPLGTAHAILCCKNVINEPFMVINADDFYGKDAYKRGYSFLKNKIRENNYGLISYKVKNTLTENGKVKRGICISENNNLIKLIESEVEKKDNIIKATPLDKNESPFRIKNTDEVSMNMLIFDKNIIEYIEDKFPYYIEKSKNDLENFEYLIPDVLFDAIKEGFAKCEIVKTASKWYGITYKKDTADVKKAILNKINRNEYPYNLWK